MAAVSPPSAVPATPDLERATQSLNRTLKAMATEVHDLGFLLQASIDPFGALPLPPPLSVLPDELAPAGDDPFGSTAAFSPTPANAPTTPLVPAGSQSAAQPLPALRIELEDDPAREDPARMEADTILVNTSHGAWRRAAADGHLEYHLAFCLGWSLAGLVEPDRSGRRFLSRFLALWGSDRATS